MYILPEMVVTAERDTAISYMLPETVVTAKRPADRIVIHDRSDLKAALDPLHEIVMPINIAYAQPLDMKVLTAAQTFGGDFTVETGDTVDEDVTVSGGNADIQGYIDGDLAVMGGKVEITGIVDGDVAVMGGSLELLGEIAGDAAVFGGAIVSKGKIGGDIFVMGGTVTLDSGSVVEGDIASIGGAVQRDSNAVVLGETSTVESEALEKYMPRIGKVFKLRNLMPRVRVFTGFMSTGPMIVAFLLSLLILVIFTKAIDRILGIIQNDFWVGVAVGIGSEIAFAPAVIFLVISIIGILPAILLGPAVFVAILFGFSGLAIVLGEKVCTSLKWKVSNRIGIFSIGWLALMIIPILAVLFSWLGPFSVLLSVIAFIVIYVEITITLGAAVYAIFKKP
jgi:hypothetical protein